MSTIKSSAEDLTLNADGSGNDVIIQSNASTLVTVDGATGNVGIGDTNPNEAKLSIDNVASGDAGLKVVQAQAQYGINIDQNGNKEALFIDSASTSYTVMQVEASALTGGSLGYFYSNSADTSSRNLFQIINDNTAATGATALYVKQDSTGLAADFVGDKIRVADGILFGTDTAAANALDDYEEGTWTPVIGGTSISGQSYETAIGFYTKIGNKVFCSFNIGFTDKGTIGGFLKIIGFPFVVSGSAANAASFTYTKQWNLTSDHHLQGTVYGTNIVYLFEASQQADTPSQLSESHIADTTSSGGSFSFTTTD